MKRASERLRKLEAASPHRKTGVFVIEGTTEAEWQAHIDELLRLGEAKPSHTFNITGVPRLTLDAAADAARCDRRRGGR